MKKLLKSLVFLCIAFCSIASSFADDVVIYLTRHGKTMFNTTHRAQGWSDTPLTKPGIDVAEQLGQGLKGTDFIAAYSSDLGRARQTAKIVLAAKGDTIDIIEMEKLRETCFGLFEGDLDPNMWNPAAKSLGYDSFDSLMKNFVSGEVTIDKMMDAIAAVEKSGEAENYAKVKTRMEQALTEIANQAKQQGGGNVLVVSHGMAILAFINDYMDPKPNNQVANASVTKIRYIDEGKFVIESVGDTSYIEKGKKELATSK